MPSDWICIPTVTIIKTRLITPVYSIRRRTDTNYNIAWRRVRYIGYRLINYDDDSDPRLEPELPESVMGMPLVVEEGHPMQEL